MTGETNMRAVVKFAVSALALSLASTANADTSASSITLEGLILQRGDLENTPLTGPDVVGDPFVAFPASQIDSDVTGGFRASFNFKLWGWEIQTTGLVAFPFEGEGTVFDANQDGTNATYDDDAHLNPGADVTTTNSDDLFALRAQHRTYLFGTDTVTPYSLGAVNFLWGTRFISLREKLTTTAFDEPNDFNGLDDDIDRVRIQSENFLYGAQIGFGGDYMVSPGVRLSGHVKGGLLANFIEVTQNFSSDDNAGNSLSKKDDDTGFAQFVEVNPKLSVSIAPNVDLTVGGYLLWINGISETTDYYRTVTDADDRAIRDDGDALFYGGTVGLTFRFN